EGAALPLERASPLAWKVSARLGAWVWGRRVPEPYHQFPFFAFRSGPVPSLLRRENLLTRLVYPVVRSPSRCVGSCRGWKDRELAASPDEECRQSGPYCRAQDREHQSCSYQSSSQRQETLSRRRPDNRLQEQRRRVPVR